MTWNLSADRLDAFWAKLPTHSPLRPDLEAGDGASGASGASGQEEAASAGQRSAAKDTSFAGRQGAAEAAGGGDALAGLEQTSWIEVRLVDIDDRPLGGVDFDLQLVNGSTRRLRTNHLGLARVDGMPRGQCRFTLPPHHLDPWTRVA